MTQKNPNSSGRESKFSSPHHFNITAYEDNGSFCVVFIDCMLQGNVEVEYVRTNPDQVGRVPDYVHAPSQHHHQQQLENFEW